MLFQLFRTIYLMLLLKTNSTQCHVIPWHTLSSIIPCYSMLFCAIPYCTSHAILETLFDAVPYYCTLFHIIPYYSILCILCYNFALFHGIPDWYVYLCALSIHLIINSTVVTGSDSLGWRPLGLARLIVPAIPLPLPVPIENLKHAHSGVWDARYLCPIGFAMRDT